MSPRGLKIQFALLLLTLGQLTGCGDSKPASSGDGGEETVIEAPVQDWDNYIPQTNYVPLEAPVSDPTCMATSSGNLCLFSKNPVAQKNASLLDLSKSSPEYLTLQTYRYELKNTEPNLVLDSSRVRVAELNGSPVNAPLSTPSWKIPFTSSNADLLAKANAFFWWNYGIQRSQSLTSLSWSANHRVRIFVGDTFNGFSGGRESLHLRTDGDRPSAALDSGIILYYLGVAEAWYANSGALFDNSGASKHTACAPTGEPKLMYGCCTTQAGCSRALISGIGEFMLALLNPDRPQLGELIANAPEGIRVCGIRRAAHDNETLTASQAFSACASTVGSGYVTTMGSLYASIWWELRKQAMVMGPNGEAEIGRLFLRHLELLRGDDDLMTARGKILYYDSVDFGGRYNIIIRQEFAKRGLGTF